MIDYAVRLRILILDSRLHRLPMLGTVCYSVFSLHSKYYAGEWVGSHQQDKRAVAIYALYDWLLKKTLVGLVRDTVRMVDGL